MCRYTNTHRMFARDGERVPAKSRQRKNEKKKNGVESSRVGCCRLRVFPSLDPLPPLSGCTPPAKSLQSPHVPPASRHIPPSDLSVPFNSPESSGRHRPPFDPLVHLLLPPLDSSSRSTPLSPRLLSWRATTRGEVLASPTSTRGVPTTLSRIYYAQFSCSRDVSSSQLRSSQRFLLFFPFYTNSILTIRLFPRPSSVSSFVLYAGSRGVCARARPLVFQCVTRAQCETTSVEYVFSLSSRGCTGRKRIARSRRKPTKLTGSATVIRDAPSPNLQTPVSRFREP